MKLEQMYHSITVSKKQDEMQEWIEAAPVLDAQFTAQRAKQELTDAIFKALKPYIHPQGVGKKMLDQESGTHVPKHIYSKTRILKYKMGQISRKDFWKDQFSRKTVAAHQSGDTRYGVGRPDRGSLYIDIDPEGHEQHRKTGNPYTAAQLQDAEQTRQWIYTQVSKYVLVAADNRLFLKWDDLVSRETFRALGKALNAASPYKATIEIKGTPRTKENFGCLARLPLFKDIEHVKHYEALPCINTTWIEGWIGTLVESTPKVTVQKTLSSSCDFHIELDDTADSYYDRAPQKVNDLKITLNDYRVFVAIQQWIKDHPNVEGTNPYTRCAHHWNMLQAQGIAEHKFNYNRYKAIRDFFSDLGLIDWVDCRHYPGVDNDGVACKWYMKDITQKRETITVKGAFTRPVLVTPYEYHSEPPMRVSPRENWYEWAMETLDTTFSGERSLTLVA